MGEVPLTRVVEGRTVPMAGSWKIDPGHTSVAFAVRHLFTLVRGRFNDLEGTIEIDETPAESRVSVSIDASSINTGSARLDEALRGENYLDVANHPMIEFATTGLTASENGRWAIDGNLTLRGTTRAVTLDTGFIGAATSPLGDLRKMSFESTTAIDRDDFGMSGVYESPDTPGVYLIGKRIDIVLDIEADLAG